MTYTTGKAGQHYIKGQRFSLEKRLHIAEVFSKTHNITKTMKIVKCSRRSVSKYKYYTHTTSLPILGRPILQSRVRNPDIISFIAQLYLSNPTLYLREACNLILTTYNIYISESEVCKIKKKILRLKRKRCSIISAAQKSQRVKQLRNVSRHSLRLLDVRQLIFIDETHFCSRNRSRLYGYYPESTPP